MIESLMRRAAAIGAAAALLFIVFATLSPIQDRPTVASQGLEHLIAFGVIGSLFLIAFPARLRRVVVLLVLAIVALEATQHLTSDRHGTVLDLTRKLVGAGIGLAAADAANCLLARYGERFGLRMVERGTERER